MLIFFEVIMKLNAKNETYLPAKSAIQHKWWLIDAQGLILGRLATEVADILRGKNKPYYTPFFDSGDFVVIVNAEKVVTTGDKEEQKVYYRHSGYVGNLKAITLAKLRANHPHRVILNAVKGMLPKNKLNRRLLRKLKVFAGPEHIHQAQQPELIKL